MRTFMVTLAYAPDMLERRQPYRAAHLERLKAAVADGLVTLAAAFNDPVDGALILFKAAQPRDIYRWLAEDPYHEAGLIRGVTVREITVAVGG